MNIYPVASKIGPKERGILEYPIIVQRVAAKNIP